MKIQNWYSSEETPQRQCDKTNDQLEKDIHNKLIKERLLPRIKNSKKSVGGQLIEKGAKYPPERPLYRRGTAHKPMKRSATLC